MYLDKSAAIIDLYDLLDYSSVATFQTTKIELSSNQSSFLTVCSMRVYVSIIYSSFTMQSKDY